MSRTHKQIVKELDILQRHGLVKWSLEAPVLIDGRAHATYKVQVAWGYSVLTQGEVDEFLDFASNALKAKQAPLPPDYPWTYESFMYRLSHCSDCDCDHSAPRDGCPCVCHEPEESEDA